MPRVRLETGELRDEIRQQLYDTEIIDNASVIQQTRSFFLNVQGKLRYLTNLRQNNMLEAAVSFRTLGLTFDAKNDAPANSRVLATIMEHSFLSFKVGEKIYWEGNGVYAAGRVYQQASAATTVAATTINNVEQHYGDNAVQGVSFGGKHYIDIPPLQTFRVDWTIEGQTPAEIARSTPVADERLHFRMALKGILRRPVQ